jgi:hypothetical protein
MGREFYYVKFKNEAGGYASAISTRQKTKAEAIVTAYEWLKNGVPISAIIKEGKEITLAVGKMPHS